MEFRVWSLKFGVWSLGKFEDPDIVPLVSEEIHNIDKFNETNVPVLNNSNHGTDYESINKVDVVDDVVDNDDERGQNKNLQTLHSLVLRHDNFTFGDEHSNDYVLQESPLDLEGNETVSEEVRSQSKI